MKPEHLYRLTGRDVLRWRRIHTISRFVLAASAIAIISLILLVARTVI